MLLISLKHRAVGLRTQDLSRLLLPSPMIPDHILFEDVFVYISRRARYCWRKTRPWHLLLLQQEFEVVANEARMWLQLRLSNQSLGGILNVQQSLHLAPHRVDMVYQFGCWGTASLEIRHGADNVYFEQAANLLPVSGQLLSVPSP